MKRDNRQISKNSLPLYLGVGIALTLSLDASAMPQRAPSFSQTLLASRNGPHGGGDAAKLWTGTSTLWNNVASWNPSGVPVAGDALTFSTLGSPYSVVNDLAGAGPLYAQIAIDAAATGYPTLSGGFKTDSLQLNSVGRARFGSGSYAFSNSAILRGTSVSDLDSAAMLTTATSGTLYLWENAQLNVNSGGAIDLPGGIIGIDDASTLRVNASGTVHSTYALIGNDQTAGPRSLSLDGAGASMRVDFQTLVHTSGFASPAGVVNIDVKNGATFSSGIVEINENATATGLTADTNITVNNAIFDVSNAVGFQNSYFVSGAAGGPGTTTIQIRNGGEFRIRDTDGSGQAFAMFSHGYRGDTIISISGTNPSDAPTLMQIDGLLYVAAADRVGGQTTQTLATITVNAGGRLNVRDGSVFACDQGYAAALDVRSGGIADLGARAIFSGGNDVTAPTGSAGTTSIIAQGEIRAGSFEYLCDSSVIANDGGSTTIQVNGPAGRIVAYGVDNPLTPEIDSGFFAASRGNGGSDLARDGTVSFEIQNTLEANEAFYAGDLQSGSFTMTVSGNSALVDAGGLFAINDRGLADSVVAVTVSNGATLKSTSFSNGAVGSIRINTVAGSGSAVIGVTSGGTLQSDGSIEVGGRLTQTNPGVFTRTAGTPASVTGDGTIVAGSTLYLGAGSTLASNRFAANGTFIEGSWLVGAGGSEKRIRTGDLHLYSSGSITFVTASSSASPTLMVTGNLTIDSGAAFDLKNNALLIRPDTGPSATTLAALKAYLANGRSGTGAGGISSSLVAPGLAIGYSTTDASGAFLGEPTLAGDLLVRYTLAGDADLSGSVGFEDLLVLAQHYNTAAEWFEGDFNFDGVASFDDLLAIAQNYNTSLISHSPGSSDFASDWLLARSLAPEPMLALLTVPFVQRRRRQFR